MWVSDFIIRHRPMLYGERLRCTLRCSSAIQPRLWFAGSNGFSACTLLTFNRARLKNRRLIVRFLPREGVDFVQLSDCGVCGWSYARQALFEQRAFKARLARWHKPLSGAIPPQRDDGAGLSVSSKKPCLAGIKIGSCRTPGTESW